MSAEEAHVWRVDYTSSKMGMWVFLFTEVLLFGGMFVIYSVYRAVHPEEFHRAAQELDVLLGTFNTLILLTSSLTMALSIAFIQRGKKNPSAICLGITILCALGFLINKYFEWGAKFSHGLYPSSPEMLLHPKGEILFFSLYYVMTGLHGIHVLVGVGVLSWMLYYLYNEAIHQTDFIWLENSGLYWHLVDVIWIFLFPLFYLIT
ncbi:MAG: cytochrome c oxidase subunit 3 family protein [bacterium]|nr:cytochrome c oxidase subunit 3 family protein [bacterium]